MYTTMLTNTATIQPNTQTNNKVSLHHSDNSAVANVTDRYVTTGGEAMELGGQSPQLFGRGSEPQEFAILYVVVRTDVP